MYTSSHFKRHNVKRSSDLTKLGQQDVAMEYIMMECKQFVAASYGFPGENDVSCKIQGREKKDGNRKVNTIL